MSTAFRFLLQAREKLYSSGLLSSVRLNHPVISIGNLTMGGTGKTPLAIAIAERLRAGGLHPVILSRGYRRTSREILVVSSVLRSAEGAPTARLGGVRWEHVGDEPYMMALRLGNVPVVVGADRYQAGLLASVADAAGPMGREAESAKAHRLYLLAGTARVLDVYNRWTAGASVDAFTGYES